MLIPATFFLLPVFRSLTPSGSGIFPHQIQDYPLRILSSKDSVTGVIVVGEILPPKADVADQTITHSFRYLRASHSLLGGVWIGSNVASLNGVPFRTDQDGTPLGDSIYTTFVLQEAVRLVNNNMQGDIGKRENALIMWVIKLPPPPPTWAFTYCCVFQRARRWYFRRCVHPTRNIYYNCGDRSCSIRCGKKVLWP